MGFGSAFATGLVKGFNQNIINEQKARALDDQKLDGLRDSLIKAVLSGDDINIAGVNAVKDMIKSGEKQLEDRGPVDIFGRPSQRLKLDTMDMAGLVNGTNDTIMIGNVAFPKPKNYDDKSLIGKPGVRASMIFDKLNSLGKTKVQSMFSNKEDLMALKEFYDTNVSFFLKDQVHNKEGKVILHKGPTDLIPIHKWMKTLVPTETDYQSKMKALKSKNLVENNQFLLPTGFKSKLGDADGVVTAETLGLDNQEVKALSGLAELQNYTDVGEFIYTSASLYTNPMNFVEGINHTARLFMMNAHQPKSQQEKSAIGKYLFDNGFDDDPLKAAYVMTPLVITKQDLATKELRQYGMSAIIDKDDLSANWKKLTGKSLDKFDEIFRATGDAESKLLRFTKLLNQVTLKPENFVTETFKFFRSIFGETGTVDQALSLIKGIDDTNRKAIKDRLTAEWSTIDQSTDQGKLLAQIAVLKYTIAADLARAEDENGRLSDQDLQRNLNKLGTFGFGTLDDARTSAKEVLFDVQRRLKNLQVIADVRDRSQANMFITFADRKLLQGDRMARSVLVQYKRDNPDNVQAVGLASEVKTEDVLNEEKYDFEPDLIGNNNEAIYQNKQTGSYVLFDRNQNKVTKVLSAGEVLNHSKYNEEGSSYEGETDMGNYDPTQPLTGTGSGTTPSPQLPSQVDITNNIGAVENRSDGQYLNGRKGRQVIQGTPPNQTVIFIFD